MLDKVQDAEDFIGREMISGELLDVYPRDADQERVGSIGDRLLLEENESALLLPISLEGALPESLCISPLCGIPGVSIEGGRGAIGAVEVLVDGAIRVRKDSSGEAVLGLELPRHRAGPRSQSN